MRNKLFSINQNSILYFCVFISLVLGVYYRLVGLGVWSLAADEYYIARSIQNIFSRGLPEFEYGGYYTRGLIYQYISAPFVYFTSAELGLRLVSVLSNLFTILITFALVKKMLNIRNAMLVVILLALSVWEIEFSRFGRMYSMYQAFFMASLYYMYEYYVDEKPHSRFFILLFAVLGAFTWEGGIFLFPFAIAITFLRNKKVLDRDFLFYLFPMILVIGYSLIKFRMMGAEPHFTIPIVPEKRISIPVDILFVRLIENIWMLCLYAVVMLFNFSVLRKLLNIDFPLYGKISFGLSFGFLCLGFVGISLCLLIFTFLVWSHGESKLLKSIKPISLIYLVNIIFWCVYLYIDVEQGAVNKEGFKGFLKSLEILFNFPDIYRNFMAPWFKVLPLTTAVLMFSTLATFYLFVTNKMADNNSVRLVLYILLFSIMLVGVAKLPYSITRYSYFFYPLLIITLVVLLEYVSGIISRRFFNGANMAYILLALVGSYMFLSEDYLYNHLSEIESYDTNFRVNYSSNVQEHYYTRYDYKTASTYINDNAEISDIVITTEETTTYYLDRVDYLFKSTSNRTYPLVATNRGKNERWSTSKLIADISVIENLILDAKNSNKHVWLILNSKKLKWMKEQRLLAEKYSDAVVYRTRDNVFEIYHFN